MNVLGLQVFVSLMLVAGAVAALFYSVQQGDHEHADRLSLLPLDDDDAAPAEMTPQPAQRPAPTTNPNKGD